MLCSIRAEVGERLPFHQHPPHELVVCLGEEGELSLDNTTFNYGVGRTFLLPSGVSHSVFGSCKRPAKTQFICFDTPTLTSMGAFPLLNYFMGDHRKLLVASLPDDARYQENVALATRLQQELDEHTVYGDTMARALLAQLLVNHMRFLNVSPVARQNSRAFAIERCCTEILENLSAPLCLVALAKKAGMSRSTFSAQFKQHTGMGLVEYVNAHRVQAAQRQLQSSEISATDIAFSLGFGNLGHFYTVFKKQVGMTPCVYREWARSQHEIRTPSVRLFEGVASAMS